MHKDNAQLPGVRLKCIIFGHRLHLLSFIVCARNSGKTAQLGRLIWAFLSPLCEESLKNLVSLLIYSKPCLKRPLSKRPELGFQDQLPLNAGQKYCRMLQGEHSAILLTFIMLPFVIKIFVLSTFEWPLKTGFTVCLILISPRPLDKGASLKINFLTSQQKHMLWVLKRTISMGWFFWAPQTTVITDV